jgi:hypothetical protein
VERPRDIGVHLKTGVGDSPNKNVFNVVRVYSHARPMQDEKTGFYINSGKYQNAFTDCEANLHHAATQCMYLGADTGGNNIVNFTGEINGAGHGIHLADNSEVAAYAGPNSIENFNHQTTGASIYDPSGNAAYEGSNAGSQKVGQPFDRTKLYGRVRIPTLIVGGLERDSKYYDSPASGDITLDIRYNIHLVPASAGNRDIILPTPLGDASSNSNARKVHQIIKFDSTDSIITIKQENNYSSGPNASNHFLCKRYDTVYVYSNGAEWIILSENNPKERWVFHDANVSGTTYNLNPHIQNHLVSAFATGNLTVNVGTAAAAVGREIYIYRSNATGGNILIPVPSLYSYTMGAQGDYLRFKSNGSAWFESGKQGSIT